MLYGWNKGKFEEKYLRKLKIDKDESLFLQRRNLERG